MNIGLIGGTGKFGTALALRLCSLGHKVLIGSRKEAKAFKVVENLLEKHPQLNTLLSGGSNKVAASQQAVFLTIPSDFLEDTLHDLKPMLDGKVVIDCCVSLKFGKTVQVALKDEKDTASRVREVLKDSLVASALKTISAAKLGKYNQILNESNFVVTKSEVAYDTFIEIFADSGLESFMVKDYFHGETVERMTALAITLNKQYPGSNFGFRMEAD